MRWRWPLTSFGQPREIRGELQHLANSFNLLFDFSAAEALIFKGEANVLKNRHVGIERIGLEHHGDAAF
jgi:hypothetical protein